LCTKLPNSYTGIRTVCSKFKKPCILPHVVFLSFGLFSQKVITNIASKYTSQFVFLLVTDCVLREKEFAVLHTYLTLRTTNLIFNGDDRAYCTDIRHVCRTAQHTGAIR